MILWRVYFADGSTFDNTQGQAWDVLDKGIICIVSPDKTAMHNNRGRVVLNGVDHYWYHIKEQEWQGCDYISLPMYLLTDIRYMVAYRQGRTIGPNEYDTIMERATTDPDFLNKAGWRKMDRGGFRKV